MLPLPISLTIGSPDVWSIEQARTKAKDRQRLIDDGKDPRDLKRDALAANANRAAAMLAQTIADAAQSGAGQAARGGWVIAARNASGKAFGSAAG